MTKFRPDCPDWKAAILDRIEPICESFLRACNGDQRYIADAFIGLLRNEHRTIQGYAIRAMVDILRKVGEDKTWGTDPRNEAAVKFCRAFASNAELSKLGIPVC